MMIIKYSSKCIEGKRKLCECHTGYFFFIIIVLPVKQRMFLKKLSFNCVYTQGCLSMPVKFTDRHAKFSKSTHETTYQFSNMRNSNLF